MRRFLSNLTLSLVTLLVLLAVSCGASDEDLDDGPADTGADMMSDEPVNTGWDVMNDEPANTGGDVMSDAPADTSRDVMNDPNAPDCGYIELEGDCGACRPLYAYEVTEEWVCELGGEQVQLACVDPMSFAGLAETCVVVDGRIFRRSTTIQHSVPESDDWRLCDEDEWNEAQCL